MHEDLRQSPEFRDNALHPDSVYAEPREPSDLSLDFDNNSESAVLHFMQWSRCSMDRRVVGLPAVTVDAWAVSWRDIQQLSSIGAVA